MQTQLAVPLSASCGSSVGAHALEPEMSGAKVGKTHHGDVARMLCG